MSQPRGPHVDARPAPVSALPSQLARALAFVAIVVGGLAGAIIGFGVVKVSCKGDCSAQKAGGSVFGALFIGIGIAIVAVLVLRAMGEWNAIKEREAPVTLGNRTTLNTHSLNTHSLNTHSLNTSSLNTSSLGRESLNTDQIWEAGTNPPQSATISTASGTPGTRETPGAPPVPGAPTSQPPESNMP